MMMHEKDKRRKDKEAERDKEAEEQKALTRPPRDKAAKGGVRK